MNYPRIIQGGMGVAVSSWPLARAVALKGQLGVVSGTALDVVLARRLQLGDIGGNVRRALDHFPVKDMAERIWSRYFIPGGKAPAAPFKSKPVPDLHPSEALNELMVVGNFVEVWLAKHGHNGPIGINMLEKIQLPTLPSLFGAMLAGVDFVLMGAGIPRAIPACLDSMSTLSLTELKIDVAGELPGDDFVFRFDPRKYAPAGMESLKRPEFLAIVSSAPLAQSLARKSTGKVNGFVIEHHTAGGHNAPPRGAMTLNEKGEPIYGPRDEADLAAFRELGLPFWLAGSYGDPEQLRYAVENGAVGIQVGTAFAYCDESGILPELKKRVLQASREGKVGVYTDPLASPTGFPFKVVQLPGTMSDPEVYKNRNRICDLGYLRTPYRKEDGTLGYRCASEPIEDFLKKGGALEDTAGRKCVCNGLLTTVGIGQVRKGSGLEPELVTSGDEVARVARFIPEGKDSYSAADVIDYLLAGIAEHAQVG